jgi:hypothetical protein
LQRCPGERSAVILAAYLARLIQPAAKDRTTVGWGIVLKLATLIGNAIRQQQYPEIMTTLP